MNNNDVMVLRKGSMVSRLSFWLVGLLLRHPYTHDTNFKELLGSHNPFTLFYIFEGNFGVGSDSIRLIQSKFYISEEKNSIQKFILQVFAIIDDTSVMNV